MQKMDIEYLDNPIWLKLLHSWMAKLKSTKASFAFHFYKPPHPVDQKDLPLSSDLREHRHTSLFVENITGVLRQASSFA